MFKVVMFDLDGTLIDSSEGVTKSAQFALKHYGIEEDDLQKLTYFIGPPLTYTFGKRYGFSEEQANEAVEVFRSRYNVKGFLECCLYPHVKECLIKLREEGYLVALATSKTETTSIKILKNLGVLELFDEISGASMDGKVETKEDVLVQLFDRLDKNHGITDRSSMVLVGDTMFDVEGAAAFGIPTLAVSFGFGDVDEMMKAGAIGVVDDMLKIPEFLKNAD